MITNSSSSDAGESAGGDAVQVRKDVPSGTIIIRRPHRMNALDLDTMNLIRDAFEDLHQERLVRAVILTGSGSAFSSGTDLYEVAEQGASREAHDCWREATETYGELIETMLRFPKPIIAAVNGPALGWGAGLVLASDIVIGGSQATIGWPEARRGLVPNLSAPLLAFRVGAGLAARLLLTGEILDSEEATRCQVFHERVDNDLVWARAMEIAEQCAEGAPTSLQMTKQMLNETIGESLFTFHSIGAANAAAARTTDTASEGVNAFVQKRDPDWQNPTGWPAP